DCGSRIADCGIPNPQSAFRNPQSGNPQSAIRNPQSVDRLCHDLFLSRSARAREDNLLFVRDRLLLGEADLAALLELYRRVRSGRKVRGDDTDRLQEALLLSGVVRLVPGSPAVLVPRNRIYARVFDREWIREHMPNAEARRQRAAYRRGLMR